jgi:hypothetical protein
LVCQSKQKTWQPTNSLITDHYPKKPIDGCSINPARSFGPALVSNTWGDFWVSSAPSLIGQSNQKAFRKPTNQPTTYYRRLPKLKPQVFVIGPIVGGVIGVMLWLVCNLEWDKPGEGAHAKDMTQAGQSDIVDVLKTGMASSPKKADAAASPAAGAFKDMA